MTRNSFVFYRSYLEAAEKLPPEMYGKFMRALMQYAFYGEEPQNLQGAALDAWNELKMSEKH